MVKLIESCDCAEAVAEYVRCAEEEAARRSALVDEQYEESWRYRVHFDAKEAARKLREKYGEEAVEALRKILARASP